MPRSKFKSKKHTRNSYLLVSSSIPKVARCRRKRLRTSDAGHWKASAGTKPDLAELDFHARPRDPLSLAAPQPPGGAGADVAGRRQLHARPDAPDRRWRPESVPHGPGRPGRQGA